MNTGFVKLSCGIINSSIRSESYPTRLMWYNMLEMADFAGNVYSSVSGLSRSANITLEETREALKVFLSKDPDSRSKEYDGRRIEEIEGGWKILNYKKYREYSYSMHPEAIRKREQRERKNKENTSGTCPGHVHDTGGTHTPHSPKTSGHSASASASVSVSSDVLSKSNLKKDIVLQKWKSESEEIIAFLNEKAGTSFSPKTSMTVGFISGRLNEGRTVDDFKTVISSKVDEWGKDDKMRQYLRPKTLFNPSNFESYLNSASIKNNSNIGSTDYPDIIGKDGHNYGHPIRHSPEIRFQKGPFKSDDPEAFEKWDKESTKLINERK